MIDREGTDDYPKRIRLGRMQWGRTLKENSQNIFSTLRPILISIAFMTLMTGCTGEGAQGVEGVTNGPKSMTPWERIKLGRYDIENMTAKEMADVGEVIIFGRLTGGNPNNTDVGKGLCPLCHTVTGMAIRNAAPNLTANDGETGVPIGLRGELRIKDPRYQKADFVQTEAFPGTGRATTGLEYIAESHVCPSCFVVVGFGKKGTHDRESPMVAMHGPPNCQSIEEAIMIETYLYMKDGLDPPLPGEIRAAHEKFIPESERVAPGC